MVGPTLISRDDYGHVVRRSIVAPDFVGKRLQGYEHLISECENLILNSQVPPMFRLFVNLVAITCGCYFGDLGYGGGWRSISYMGDRYDYGPIWV